MTRTKYDTIAENPDDECDINGCWNEAVNVLRDYRSSSGSRTKMVGNRRRCFEHTHPLDIVILGPGCRETSTTSPF